MLSAYLKGWASQGTRVDWDDAEARFSSKYCPPHNPSAFCELEHAWASGWSDRAEGRERRHALTCPNGGVTYDHGDCEVL